MGRRTKKNGLRDARHHERQKKPSALDSVPTGKETGLRDHYTVLAICGLLLLAVALVFGQTLQHDFVNYDDDVYVYNNPTIMQGLTAQGIGWALTARPCQQLASVDVALAHDGLPTLWSAVAGRAPSDQRPAACAPRRSSSSWFCGR